MSEGSHSNQCTYVTLSEYDWSLYDILKGPRGRCHGVSFAFNPAVWCLAAALHAVTVWMALGLNFQLLTTFKRRTTLYFWSIVVTTWGILICTITFDIRYFTRAGNGDALQWIQSVAWIFESVGFSFVLFSRLHLIVDSWKLKIIPPVIICLDSIVHTLVLVGKSGHLTPRTWHVVLTFTPAFFTAQETILSSLYIYLFVRFMHHNSYGTRTKSMLKFLIIAEIFIICFDVAMVTLNSLRYEIAKLVLTPFFYASKLKMEFLVLNRLMDFRQKNNSLMYSGSDIWGENAANYQNSFGPRSADRSSTTQSVPQPEANKLDMPHVSSPTAAHDMKLQGNIDAVDQLERQYLGRVTSEPAG